MEKIYLRYHKPRYMRMDPIEPIRRFSGGRNREIAGLLASALAYGKVETIRATVEKVFSITGRDILDFACSTSFKRKKELFHGFKHRFNDGADIALFFECVRKAIYEKGSLEALFGQAMTGDEDTIKRPLNEFVKRMRRWAAESADVVPDSFLHLFPMPESGSACKRLNMYLRWMVRKNDGIDIGIWKNVGPEKLLIPVDTHVAAMARRLALTSRKNADWRMAEEITGNLKKISPLDPVKYDFSLCRAGMVRFRNSIKVSTRFASILQT